MVCLEYFSFVTDNKLGFFVKIIYFLYCILKDKNIDNYFIRFESERVYDSENRAHCYLLFSPCMSEIRMLLHLIYLFRFWLLILKSGIVSICMLD